MVHWRAPRFLPSRPQPGALQSVRRRCRLDLPATLAGLLIAAGMLWALAAAMRAS